MTVGEDFCGEYKGTHEFEPGENSCRCGRAFKRAPRPPVDTEINLHGWRPKPLDEQIPGELNLEHD